VISTLVGIKLGILNASAYAGCLRGVPITIRFILIGIVLAVCVRSAVGQTLTTIDFTYPDRAALLADGWDFLARTANGGVRNTEQTNGTVPPDVSYNQAVHPGVVRIPADVGDLWASANNTRNSLFRDLATNWSSVRLELAFAPSQPFQQVNLMIYQDDDNYFEVGHVYGYPTNEQVGVSRENNGTPTTLAAVAFTATNLHLRMDRDLEYGDLSSFYSLDGTNWMALGTGAPGLVRPRLGIWVGGSPGGYPFADLRRLEIVTTNMPVATTLALQPPELVFSTVVGQVLTNHQKLRVNHRGPQRLSWTMTNLPTWLVVTATNGATGVGEGVHQATVQFVAEGAANNPQPYTVSAIVNPAARARLATWKGGKSGVMSVSVDDGLGKMYGVLRTNGQVGTYVMNGTNAPSFYNEYYTNGMELGCHLVDHPCTIFAGSNLVYEIEANLNGLAATTLQSSNDIISLVWPCGVNNDDMRGRAGEYFLSTRGYNINALEDATPADFMKLKSFNSHEHDPFGYNPSAAPNPADLKTVVDEAIVAGKWANLVFHGFDNDDGAVAYAVGKDIWVDTIGAVTKYIHQRDRTVISNYVEGVGMVQFDCYRLPIAPSRVRSFESAIGTNDLVTLAVSLGSVGVISNLTVDGVATTNYTTRLVGADTLLYLDTVVTSTPKRMVVNYTSITNLPPINLSVAVVDATNLVVSWNSVSNYTYRVQYKNDLNDQTWHDLIPDSYAISSQTSVTNPIPADQAQRFYRVRLIP
jgi:hypothetical protein